MNEPMNITRRQALMQSLFGAGLVGLRALATGLPVSFLMNPRRALALNTCTAPGKAQYIILSTSGNGDPINANAPGTFGVDSRIIHSADPQMAATNFTLNGQSVTAAKPWSTPATGGVMPQAVLDRTVFWHLMTNTPIHPKEPDVLQLMGASVGHEMLPSLLAKATAPCLNTVQAQPVSVGGSGPSEALSFSGAPQPTIPPLALKDTLITPAGPIANLMDLRRSTMDNIYSLYKTVATPAQKTFIDNLSTTQTQAKNINTSLLSALSSINNNGVAAQITAAITLIQMNISPVIAIHIPFGGDNHQDNALGNETAQTVAGVASIASLMAQLQTNNLQDKVTFMSLNVFGRTLMVNAGGPATNGRTHNPNHQVSITIGKPFKGGVVGGITPVGNDFGAMSINSTTGAGVASGGDITPVDSLGAFAQSVLSGVGGDTSVVTRGKVITPVLA
jgi:hypothetical protein